MARRRRVLAGKDPFDDIVGYYQDRLTQPVELPKYRYPPVVLGPTWRVEDGHWLLPEFSLGWSVLGFSGSWLKHKTGKPWVYTDEQARFILWWYAIDGEGEFLFRDGVLQRLKGWGKDPIGACLMFTEAFGPCRFGGWEKGAPIAIDVPDAWVQTAAVALEQTKNTMRLFPSLITDEAKKRFRIQPGKEMIHGLGDTRLMQAVTSSPDTLEGARSTFVLANETQHWTASNTGHDMADVIERNQTKSEDGGARRLAITNAYEPSKDSVAQRDREAYEKVLAGGAVDTGIFYDSLEAPPDAPLTAEAAPDVVIAIRGDSVWLRPNVIVKSILDIRNPPSRSRRFWYNQITASEDAVWSYQEWDAAADPSLVVEAGDIITLGFDGSLTDDHCALIGCHVELDHLFEIGVWEPDPRTGEVDRRAIDRKVRATKELYDVVGFYSDQRPFESYVDKWAEDFGADLCIKASPHQAVAWPIDRRTKLFTDAVGRLHQAVLESAREATRAAETETEPGPRLTHDGARRFRLHMLNARRAYNEWGFSLRKEHRESNKKIDAAPAATLARLARMDYLALPESKRRKKKRSGKVWGSA